MKPSFLMSEEEIDLAFQPIVTLNSSSVYSYETLVRFVNKEPHETQETVSFIEASGKALLLDRRVSLKLLNCLNDRSFLDDTPLSLNITGHSVSSRTFLHWFESFVSRIERPERLMVELTETLPVTDMTQALSFFSFCRKNGISITLDDFGTGHSNADRLHEFKFRGAKLDGTFVKSWHNNPNSYQKALELSELSTRMGLTTTAEFINTTQDIKLAREIGFHNVQGHLIGLASPEPIEPKHLISQLKAKGVFN